jgi:toxin ParE1/3/4
LLRIARWIARDNPAAADSVLRQIDKAFLFIKSSPRAGPPREEIGPDLRIVPVGNYLVIYRVDQRGPLILRVVHGAMDISKIEL